MDPWGPSQMSRIPPADRQSISRLLLSAALRPCLSFVISHMARMVYGSSSSQSTHPSPRSAPPIYTPACPSQSQQPSYYYSSYLYVCTYLHTYTLSLPQPHGLPLLDLPPGASTLLCRNARRHTCNAPASLPRPGCSTAREACCCCCPLISTLRPRAQKPTRSVLCRLTSASQSVDARSHSSTRQASCVPGGLAGRVFLLLR